MAKKKKYTVAVHIPINGEYYKWYEVDEDRNVTWFLPKDSEEAQKVVEKMLENVGEGMSRFYAEHPELLNCNENKTVERVS